MKPNSLITRQILSGWSRSKNSYTWNSINKINYRNGRGVFYTRIKLQLPLKKSDINQTLKTSSNSPTHLLALMGMPSELEKESNQSLNNQKTIQSDSFHHSVCEWMRWFFLYFQHDDECSNLMGGKALLTTTDSAFQDFVNYSHYHQSYHSCCCYCSLHYFNEHEDQYLRQASQIDKQGMYCAEPTKELYNQSGKYGYMASV